MGTPAPRWPTPGPAILFLGVSFFKRLTPCGRMLIRLGKGGANGGRFGTWAEATAATETIRIAMRTKNAKHFMIC
jgi:hypothetical protein